MGACTRAHDGSHTGDSNGDKWVAAVPEYCIPQVHGLYIQHDQVRLCVRASF